MAKNEVLIMLEFIKSLTDEKDKSKLKTKEFAEVTTPLWLIEKQIELIPQSEILNLNSKVLDPCTGDGRYLMIYLYKRLPSIKSIDDLYQAVESLYGIELQDTNVERDRNNIFLCCQFISNKNNWIMDNNRIETIINKNIVQGNFIK